MVSNRIWICLQLILKEKLNMCNVMEDIRIFKQLLGIFDDEVRNESHILTPFVYFLRNKMSKLEIVYSHEVNRSLNEISSKVKLH